MLLAPSVSRLLVCFLTRYTVVGYADYHTLSQEVSILHCSAIPQGLIHRKWELVPSGTTGRWKIMSVFKKCYLSVEGEIHNATLVVGIASASEWIIEKVEKESRYMYIFPETV